jgi:hypothetical protein
LEIKTSSFMTLYETFKLILNFKIDICKTSKRLTYIITERKNKLWSPLLIIYLIMDRRVVKTILLGINLQRVTEISYLFSKFVSKLAFVWYEWARLKRE